jgi:hypothetical protein
MATVDIRLNIVPPTATAQRAAAHRWELSTREREMQKLMVGGAK